MALLMRKWGCVVWIMCREPRVDNRLTRPPLETQAITSQSLRFIWLQRNLRQVVLKTLLQPWMWSLDDCSLFQQGARTLKPLTESSIPSWLSTLICRRRSFLKRAQPFKSKRSNEQLCNDGFGTYHCGSQRFELRAVMHWTGRSGTGMLDRTHAPFEKH